MAKYRLVREIPKCGVSQSHFTGEGVKSCSRPRVRSAKSPKRSDNTVQKQGTRKKKGGVVESQLKRRKNQLVLKNKVPTMSKFV